MKARVILIAAALTALTLLSAGCKKHSYWRPEAGKQIQFRATSDASHMTADTKTAYSGEYYTVGESKYERIDWVDGDMITIGYVSFGGNDGFHADADHYRITDVTTDGRFSKAKLSPVSGPYGVDGEGWGGNGLKWRDNTHHRFFATYPSVDLNGEHFKFDIENNDLVVNVPYYYPETQPIKSTSTELITFDGEDNVEATVFHPDMSYAYLFCNPADYYGTLGTDEEYLATGETIDLPFVPHFTAFEISAAAKEGDSFRLNSASIISGDTSRPMTGMYIFQKVEPREGESERWDDLPLEGAVSQKAKINFTDLDVDEDSPVVFTFLACSWNGFTKLVLSFNITFEDAEHVEHTVNRSIRLSYAYNSESNWLWFSSSRKHRILNLRIPVEANAVWFDGVSAGEFELVDLDI